MLRESSPRKRDLLLWRHVWRRSVFRIVAGLASLAIETLFIPASLVGLIVLLASFVPTLATVLCATAERTAEILPVCVPRMREETNSAAATTDRTVFQIRTIAQDGIEPELILTNKRKGAVVLMPILAKRENLGDGYDKNARFSVKMLILCCISSSYGLDAKASRCRARIFYAEARKIPEPIRATDRHVSNSPTYSSCPADLTALHASQAATWKEKPSCLKNDPLLLFQVVNHLDERGPGHSAERHRPERHGPLKTTRRYPRTARSAPPTPRPNPNRGPRRELPRTAPTRSRTGGN